MTDRDRLIELIKQGIDKHESYIENYVHPIWEFLSDCLLANGVIVAPMPMAEWLRKELTEYVHQRCMEEL